MTCLVCGGQWFRVYAVTLRTDATVSGYAGDPECIDCHPVTVPAS